MLNEKPSLWGKRKRENLLYSISLLVEGRDMRGQEIQKSKVFGQKMDYIRLCTNRRSDAPFVIRDHKSW